MNNDDFHIEHEPEDIIDVFSGNQEIISYGFYTQITAHKEHFSSMQNKYRSLTSTWVLASFAGFGYLLSGHQDLDLPCNTFLGIIILSFFSGLGVTLLWFLDVVLYQRLWLGSVVELARLEEEHDWLPKCNLNTLVLRNSNKFRFIQSTFYIGINWVFITISAIISIYYHHQPIELLAICPTTLIIYWTIAKLMLKKSGELEKIDTQSFR